MHTVTDTPIEYLKGVGPKRAALLRAELGIGTFEDLMYYFPFRYVDKSVFYRINELSEDLGYVQIKGKIISMEEAGVKHNKRLSVQFTDGNGYMQLVWFKGVRWIKSMLKINAEYVAFGKISRYGKWFSMAHPELEPLSPEHHKVAGGLQPVYHSTEKLASSWLNSKGIEKLMRNLFDRTKGEIGEILPESILERYSLPCREEALRNIHFPKSDEQYRKAVYRLKFEEFFYIQLGILHLKAKRQQKQKGYVFPKIGKLFQAFYNEALPFELTSAQKRVIKEMRSDMRSGKQMNRLLQGDVGSGKTIVALMCMLIALDNGYQAALMSPTEILASQHYKTLTQMLCNIGVKVALLTGNVKGKKRKNMLDELKKGDIRILIGTHALIQDQVAFHHLGLAVIDEQHRFGVAQRARLWTKGHTAPHILVMTATPIPRTLAMTLYGDLDVSVIDELPPGRKKVKTVHRYETSRLRVFGFLKEQIAAGRQVYIVYPLIEESQNLDYKNLMDGFEVISNEFPIPDYQVSIIHGQMKPDIKEFEMQRFVKGETDLMVATNVIEVGVDVPNASVMLIESAERFGLSQLHQLRGRVGRGAEQSFCILLTAKELTSNSLKRMQTMIRTNDGFEIAEADLQLRGPGNLMGTRQSGIPEMKIANLAKDGHILQLSRTAVAELLKNDPELNRPAHKMIKETYLKKSKDKRDWSRIS